MQEQLLLQQLVLVQQAPTNNTIVTFTYSGNNSYTGCKLYYNGVAQRAYNTGIGVYSHLTTSNCDLILGGFSTVFPIEVVFHGTMTDFRIWNSELTPTDVASVVAEFNSPNTVSAGTLLAQRLIP